MNNTVYTVYWTVWQQRPGEESWRIEWKYFTGDDLPISPATPQPFMKRINSLTEALMFCEALRKQRRDGERIEAITMVAENPDCVGQAGVDVTGPNYDWKKRREQ